ARARSLPLPGGQVPVVTLLQWGRARAGAEFFSIILSQFFSVLGFNGAAPARARSCLCCYSLWRKLAILQSRLLALFGFLSCSCCLVGSSLSFSIRRFRHASA